MRACVRVCVLALLRRIRARARFLYGTAIAPLLRRYCGSLLRRYYAGSGSWNRYCTSIADRRYCAAIARIVIAPLVHRYCVAILPDPGLSRATGNRLSGRVETIRNFHGKLLIAPIVIYAIYAVNTGEFSRRWGNRLLGRVTGK